MSHDPPRSAYVHVPFCRHRCGYCNFTLVAGRDDLIESYLAALATELSWLEVPRPVQTLFLGGGTPTHLSAEQLARLLDLVTHWFPPEVGAEFSVEANPLDLDRDRTQALAAAGVTRISLGAQSFDDRKLAILERDHRREDIERAFAAARSFASSVSLDLIFAAPGETLEDWRRDLDAALALAPDHVSTYGLTFEKGTSYWSRRQRGSLTAAEEDDEARMYELAIDTLTAAGYEHYEVSSFARPGPVGQAFSLPAGVGQASSLPAAIVGESSSLPIHSPGEWTTLSHRCRHNEVYWTLGSYYAAGPGASRHLAGRRETNHKSTTTYIRRVLAGQSPVAESEELDAEDRARERLVFGLRRLEGIATSDFARQTGYDLAALGGAALTRFLDQGLLERTSTHLRLTRRGLLVSDALWPALLRR